MHDDTDQPAAGWYQRSVGDAGFEVHRVEFVDDQLWKKDELSVKDWIRPEMYKLSSISHGHAFAVAERSALSETPELYRVNDFFFLNVAASEPVLTTDGRRTVNSGSIVSTRPPNNADVITVKTPDRPFRREVCERVKH